MKFTCFVEINQPRRRVIELWENPDNLKEWQDGFVSLDIINGPPGEPGTKSKLKYRRGKRDMELIETIHQNNLPDEMSILNETDMVIL